MSRVATFLAALLLFLGAADIAFAIPSPGSPAIQPANGYATIVQNGGNPLDITVTATKPGYGVFWVAIFGDQASGPLSNTVNWATAPDSFAAVWRTNNGTGPSGETLVVPGQAGYQNNPHSGRFVASGPSKTAQYVIHVINFSNGNTFWTYPNENHPPTPKHDCVSALVTCNGSVSVPLSALVANFTDPDNDPITFKSLGTPSCGAAQVVGTSVVYTPGTGCSGDVAIPYTVTDGQGNTAGANICITIDRTAPNAVDDCPVTTPANAPLLIDVLANDSDPNHETLTITSVTAPSHGTAAIQNNKVLYTPAAGYYGADSFTYTIANQRCGTDTAKVCINVLPPPGKLCGTAYCKDSAGQTGLNGVLITLKDSSGHTITTATTAQDGSYCFGNLAPGTYIVIAESPSGGRVIDTTTSNTSFTVTVNPTQSVTVNDFIYKTGSISGYAFQDTSGNCTHNPGDTGVSGVLVTLKDAAGTTVATTTTAADGSYSFQGCALVAGTYTVTASGWSSTFTLSGSATLTPILLPGTDSPNNNFCFHGPGNLSGHVYCQQGTTNIPLQGVTVTLYNAANQVVTTATTDANGFYQFTDVPVGAYTIVAPVTATGRGLTSAASLPATVVSDQTKSGFDFTYKGGAISGYAFQDTSGNCTHDANSINLQGITVTLKDAAGKTVDTTLTNASGYYEFTGCALVAGNYTVTASGWSNTLTLSGSATLNIPLPEAGNSPNNNFCFHQKPGAVCGQAYCKDSKGTTPMQGVLITLIDSTGKTVTTTTTGPDGKFCFQNVAVGTYNVVAETPSGGRVIDTTSSNTSFTVTVTATNTSTVPDFIYTAGSISGYAFQDTSGNCTHNPGDTGVSGVLVTLKDAAGTTVATTTTAADGSYSFQGCALVAGTYTVTASGWSSTFTLSGSATLNITLQPGQGSPNNNFCFHETPGKVCGVAYCQDSSGKTPMQGVLITLIDSNGKTVTTKLTGTDGSYCFENVAPGTYNVVTESPSGGRIINTATSNTSYTVTLAANGSVNVNDFIYQGGSISGFAYVDKNGDCHMDPGESGLKGVLITLKDSAGTTLTTTTTAADGSYSFQGCYLVAGTYTVTAPGTVQTFTLAGSATLTPILLPGDSSPNNNFCYTKKQKCSKILLFGPDITTEIYNYLVNDQNGPRIPPGQIVYVQTPLTYDPAHPDPLTDALNAKIAADGLPYCTMVFDSEYVGPAGVWSGLSTADQARLKQEILNGMGFVYAEPMGASPAPPQAQLPDVLPVVSYFQCDYRQLYKIVDPASPLAVGLPPVFNAASGCQNTRIDLIPVTGVTYANVDTVAVSASGDPTAIYSIPGTGGPSVLAFDYIPTGVPGSAGGRVAIIGTDPFPQSNPIPGYETDFASINRLFYNAILWTGHFGNSVVGPDAANVIKALKIAGGLSAATSSDVTQIHTNGAPSQISIVDGVHLMRKATGLDQ